MEDCTSLRLLRRPPRGVARWACIPSLLALACWGGETAELGPTARAERGRIERIVVATGTVEPEKEIEVRPRISGIVQAVHVKAGDRVETGQALVEIDRELLEAQAKEIRSRLEGSRVEQRYALSEFKRASALRKGGAVAEQEYDRAEAHYRGALASVARDEATVEYLEVQLRHTTVVAPMAAKILDVDVEEGDAVSAVTSVTGGTRLLTLAAHEVLHLKGLVDENEVAHVQVEQTARIRTEAYRDKVFAGRVREIAPIGQREQNVTYFEVEIEFTDADASLLRPRMSGDAEIITEVVEDALLVPETALLYEGDVIYVRTLRPGDEQAVERRNVTIGIVDGDRVQILSGLDSGEEILLE